MREKCDTCQKLLVVTKKQQTLLKELYKMLEIRDFEIAQLKKEWTKKIFQ